MPGVEQAVPNRLTDSKPIEIDTDVKRMSAILLSYILRMESKFCAKKFSYPRFLSQTSKLWADV